MNFIIEGVDNVGKGTLIQGIQERLGFYNIIKYDKPKALPIYGGSLQDYQMNSFKRGFELLRAAAMTNSRVIFDRFHLGEMVYSPIYRGYSGHYVIELEKSVFINDMFKKVSRNVELILLVAPKPEALPDDGKSFDPSKIRQEQAMFENAFSYSKFSKRIVQVQDLEGNFRPKEDIIQDAIGHLIP